MHDAANQTQGLYNDVDDAEDVSCRHSDINVKGCRRYKSYIGKVYCGNFHFKTESKGSHPTSN